MNWHSNLLGGLCEKCRTKKKIDVLLEKIKDDDLLDEAAREGIAMEIREIRAMI